MQTVMWSRLEQSNELQGSRETQEAAAGVITMVDVRQLRPSHTPSLPRARSLTPGPAVSLPVQRHTYVILFYRNRKETQALRGQQAQRGKSGTLVGERVLWPQMSFCLAC